jgi:prepilin-type N-terminal cleavage/methylation domain-containing protein
MSPHRRQRAALRSAFTLVELLVVIAVIGILVALLLPAIQASREAGRRAQCKNNLKNIGVACLNHADTFKVFPTGGATWGQDIAYNIEGDKPLGPDRQGIGWGFQILPFLEETAAHSITTNDDILQVVVSVYACPSRRAPKTVFSKYFQKIVAVIDYAGAQPCALRDPTAPVASYYDPLVGVPFTPAGYGQLAPSFYGGARYSVTQAPPDNGVYEGVIVRCPWRRRFGAAGGPYIGAWVVGVPKPTKYSTIGDGTSRTLMIAEKYVRNDNYDGGDLSDDHGWAEGWDGDQMRSTAFPPINDADPIGWRPDVDQYFGDRGLFQGFYNVLHFGAAHPTGIEAVFADGSVRMISYEIDARTFNAFGTRDGGETVDANVAN